MAQAIYGGNVSTAKNLFAGAQRAKEAGNWMRRRTLAALSHPHGGL